MDVHPPLAKLLITLFGYLAGFDGEFDFKEIGKDYIEPGVPYVAMRLFPAICGILLAPTMFLTLKAAGCRTITATLGAGLIIFGTFSRPIVACLPWSPANAVLRERASYSGSLDPLGLSSHDRDRLHRPSLHLLHQPARARSHQGVPAELVVLARHDRSRPGRHRQHQVGWALHYCLGWSFDSGPTVGSAW